MCKNKTIKAHMVVTQNKITAIKHKLEKLEISNDFNALNTVTKLDRRTVIARFAECANLQAQISAHYRSYYALAHESSVLNFERAA